MPSHPTVHKKGSLDVCTLVQRRCTTQSYREAHADVSDRRFGGARRVQSGRRTVGNERPRIVGVERPRIVAVNSPSIARGDSL
jgi:hypothetical protein